MHTAKSVAFIALVSFLTMALVNRVSFLRAIARTDPA